MFLFIVFYRKAKTKKNSSRMRLKLPKRKIGMFFYCFFFFNYWKGINNFISSCLEIRLHKQQEPLRQYPPLRPPNNDGQPSLQPTPLKHLLDQPQPPPHRVSNPAMLLAVKGRLHPTRLISNNNKVLLFPMNQHEWVLELPRVQGRSMANNLNSCLHPASLT